MAKRKLTEEQEKQIVILNRCGITYPVLEKEFGISSATLVHSKKRAEVDEIYKKKRAPRQNLDFAIKTYNFTQDEFIKQKLEQYRFFPFIEKISDYYSKYGIMPEIDSYLRLWGAIFGDSNFEKYSIKVEKEEVNKVASDKITKANSEEELIKKIKANILQKYHKPFPSILKQRIDEVLEHLNEIERKVLILRYGLEDKEIKTLNQVGEIVHKSRERIRSIEAKALRKLRHPMRSNKIRNISDEYVRYLNSGLDDYAKKDELEIILDQTIKSLEGKEGDLEGGIVKILQKHKEDLSNFYPVSRIEKSLYLSLITYLVSHLNDTRAKVEGISISLSKDLKVEEKKQLLEEQKSYLQYLQERNELKDKLSIPVSQFESNIRLANCFKEIGIKYIGDLVQKTDEELLKYRNFGKKTLQEVIDVLTKMNLRLGMENVPKYK